MNEEQYHARGMFHEVTDSAFAPIWLCRAQIYVTGCVMRTDYHYCFAVRQTVVPAVSLSMAQARPPSGGPAVTVPALVPKLSGTPGGTMVGGA